MEDDSMLETAQVNLPIWKTALQNY